MIIIESFVSPPSSAKKKMVLSLIYGVNRLFPKQALITI